VSATPSFPYRLAATDLDGTLLGPDKRISHANLQAVQALHARGARLLLASGRRHQNSVRIQRELGLDGPVIACQGAMIKDCASDEVIEAHLLPPALAAELVGEGQRRGFCVIYYHLDHLFVAARHNRWIDLYERRVGEVAEVLPDLHSLRGEAALKIVWYGDPARLSALRPRLEADYGGRLQVLSTDVENLEFMLPGINKASALATVAARLGVGQAETMAFGDGENDVPMLGWAHLGVAVDHGVPAARAAADLISPPGDPATSFARAVQVILEQYG
jgi:Cof subfamily protein (haloacid dehalogenase superfamily)